ncbi:YceI family protein [Pseudonocardia acaciae]|uniref:YceI family protein n=1 Tax=Pseudonocardia acaciae TaxID=551276 RepID=UPI00048DF97C|nr:YceI family protein [Pseudonocardia acaciae]
MSTTETVALAAGTWDIDPVHSDVSFTVRHMMVSRIRGRFGAFTGTIVTSPDVLGSSVTASIDVGSVDTGNDQRDEHVRSAQFLDAQNHPTMTYRSTGVRANGDGYVIDGELTLHGATRPVQLDVNLGGIGPDPWGGTRIGFAATATIDRRDFGIDVSLPFDGGGVVVSDRVEIELNVEAVLRTE